MVNTIQNSLARPEAFSLLSLSQHTHKKKKKNPIARNFTAERISPPKPPIHPLYHTHPLTPTYAHAHREAATKRHVCVKYCANNNCYNGVTWRATPSHRSQQLSAVQLQAGNLRSTKMYMEYTNVTTKISRRNSFVTEK